MANGSDQSIRHTLADAFAQAGRGIGRAAWPGYCLFVVCIVVFLAVVGRHVAVRNRKFQKAGNSRAIALPDSIPTAAPKDVKPKLGAPQAKSEGKEATSQTPLIEWKSSKYAYRAAALLARNNDLRSAIALLNESNVDSSSVEALADAAISKLRTSVGPIVTHELSALNTYWKSLDQTKGAALFSLPRQGEWSKLEAQINTGKAGIAEIDAHLPQTIKYCLMCNLHVELRKASKAPETVVELFVETAFPSESLASKLYLEKRPGVRTPFSEHAKVFSKTLDQKIVWPLARDFIAQETTKAVAAGKEGQDWRMKIWGKDFCEGLRKYDPLTSEEAAALQLWQKLNAPMRKLWAENLTTNLLRSHRIALSDAAIAANPWLRDSAQSVDDKFLLDAVRSYPAWQTALRSFDYRDAEKATISALKELWAGKYKLRRGSKELQINWDRLLSGLRYEERVLASKGFAWTTLSRELGGVQEGVPEPIRNSWGLFRSPTRGKRWSSIKPRYVYAALIRMAKKNNAKRVQYSLLAKRYAENRDLRLKQK